MTAVSNTMKHVVCLFYKFSVFQQLPVVYYWFNKKTTDLTTLKAYLHKSVLRQGHEYSLSKLCTVGYYLHDVDVTFDADEPHPQLLGGDVPAGTRHNNTWWGRTCRYKAA